MNLTNFRLETDADGIALLTWDMPGKSMNVIDMDVIRELGEAVDHVVATEAIKGCVVTSGKKDSFSAAPISPCWKALACSSRSSQRATASTRR